jgi:plastocyanin
VIAVAIDGTSYRPAVVTVERGTRVEWKNEDPFPHTVTKPGAFDSGSMAPGAKWSYVASKPGTYDYICTLHPNMKGTLVVR